MTYQRYAIGQKGQPPRIVLTADVTDAFANVAAGEVCVDATVLSDAPVQISADGTALVPGVVPLADVQAARWVEAKAYRAAKMASGCATPLGRVQTDANSRDAITQAAADAMSNRVAVPAWSIVWIMADNSAVTHSVAQMIAMAAAVRSYVAGCQAASQPIRKAIYAATSAAAVSAVDITAGYPTG